MNKMCRKKTCGKWCTETKDQADITVQFKSVHHVVRALKKALKLCTPPCHSLMYYYYNFPSVAFGIVPMLDITGFYPQPHLEFHQPVS